MALKIDEKLPEALDELADVQIPGVFAQLEEAGNDLKLAYNKNRDHIAQSDEVFQEISKLIGFCENFKNNVSVIQAGIRVTAEKARNLREKGFFR